MTGTTKRLQCIYKLAHNGSIIKCNKVRGHEGKHFFEGYTSTNGDKRN